MRDPQFLHLLRQTSGPIARRLAARWGLRSVEVPTAELEDPAYVANDLDRCYHCKRELMDVLMPLAVSENATVVLGVNLDDLTDHRPGQKAAAERGAGFPLVEAGLDKATVRALRDPSGSDLGPARSRMPRLRAHGTPVAFGILDQVAKAESALRRLGFSALRVRHYGDLARVEIPLDDLDRALLIPDRGRGGSARRRLPLRDARSRGTPLGEPVHAPQLRRRPGRRDPGSRRPTSDQPTWIHEHPGPAPFPEELVREPIVARLVRRFDVEPNIRRASVEAHEGWLICELDGDPAAVEGAVRRCRLEETGVRVDRLGDMLES